MSQAKPEWGGRRIAKMLNVTEGRVTQLVTEGVIPAAIGREYNPDDVVRRYIAWRLDRSTEAQKEDRARKEKADADIAETKSAQMDGTLVFRSDYLNNFADAIAQGVYRISRLKALTSAQKEAVFAELRAVKLPELPVAGEKDEPAD